MTHSSRPIHLGQVRVIRHSRHCLRLRWRLEKLQVLLDTHTFWAAGRSKAQLRRMLMGSQVVVSAWCGRNELVGFGRATSDGVFRSVLWDVVVADGHQGQGIGRALVGTLLAAPMLAQVDRTYLMTTNSRGFYSQLGFREVVGQHLLLLSRENLPE